MVALNSQAIPLRWLSVSGATFVLIVTWRDGVAASATDSADSPNQHGDSDDPSSCNEPATAGVRRFQRSDIYPSLICFPPNGESGRVSRQTAWQAHILHDIWAIRSRRRWYWR